jgi:hypothetical protein
LGDRRLQTSRITWPAMGQRPFWRVAKVPRFGRDQRRGSASAMRAARRLQTGTARHSPTSKGATATASPSHTRERTNGGAPPPRCRNVAPRCRPHQPSRITRSPRGNDWLPQTIRPLLYRQRRCDGLVPGAGELRGPPIADGGGVEGNLDPGLNAHLADGDANPGSVW